MSQNGRNVSHVHYTCSGARPPRRHKSLCAGGRKPGTANTSARPPYDKMAPFLIIHGGRVVKWLKQKGVKSAKTYLSTIVTSFAKKPYIFAKEPYIFAKMPYIFVEQPCVSAKEPYIPAKQPHIGQWQSDWSLMRVISVRHISLQKPCLSAKVKSFRKRALYFRKRALYFRKGAMYSRKNAQDALTKAPHRQMAECMQQKGATSARESYISAKEPDICRTAEDPDLSANRAPYFRRRTLYSRTRAPCLRKRATCIHQTKSKKKQYQQQSPIVP